MKQIGLLTLAFVFSFIQVDAQKAKDKVEMAFDKTVDGITAHDFGSIVFGANGKVDFTYTNNGTKPILISNVESSCGCTVPTWTKSPVEPGKQGTVSIEYDTKLIGVFNKTVVVYSNASNSPVRIEIRGKINAKPSDLTKPTAPVSDESAQGQNIAAPRVGDKNLQEKKAAEARLAAQKLVAGENAKPEATKPAAATKPATTATKTTGTAVKKN